MSYSNPALGHPPKKMGVFPWKSSWKKWISQPEIKPRFTPYYSPVVSPSETNLLVNQDTNAGEGRVNNPLWMVSVHDRMLVTASFQHKINTSLGGFKPQMGPEMGVSEDGVFPQIGNFMAIIMINQCIWGYPNTPNSRIQSHTSIYLLILDASPIGWDPWEWTV